MFFPGGFRPGSSRKTVCSKISNNHMLDRGSGREREKIYNNMARSGHDVARSGHDVAKSGLDVAKNGQEVSKGAPKRFRSSLKEAAKKENETMIRADDIQGVTEENIDENIIKKRKIASKKEKNYDFNLKENEEKEQETKLTFAFSSEHSKPDYSIRKC